jgi:hypothetical protein
MSGVITMAAGSIASALTNTNYFTVSNSNVAVTDTVILSLQASGATAGAYIISCAGVQAGSFVVAITNTTAGGLNETLKVNFSILKAVNS